KLSLRSNLDYAVGNVLSLSFSLGTIRQTTRAASVMQPITTHILWGLPALKDTPTRGYLATAPEAFENDVEGYDDVDRTIVSVQARHNQSGWLGHRLAVGGDFAFNRGTRLFHRTAQQPGPFGASSQGQKEVENDRTSFVTIDYSATAGFDLTSSMRAETT